MTAKELKTICEALGFGIAHARSYPRLGGEVRAYVATWRNGADRNVRELRWSPRNPGIITAYGAAERVQPRLRTFALPKHPTRTGGPVAQGKRAEQGPAYVPGAPTMRDFILPMNHHRM
jgi:hypothetical protein